MPVAASRRPQVAMHLWTCWFYHILTTDDRRGYSRYECSGIHHYSFVAQSWKGFAGHVICSGHRSRDHP